MTKVIQGEEMRLKLMVKGYQRGSVGGIGIKLTDEDNKVLAKSGIPISLEGIITTTSGFELVSVYIALTGLMAFRSQVLHDPQRIRVVLETSTKFITTLLSKSVSTWDSSLSIWLSRIADRLLSLERMGVDVSFQQRSTDADVLRLAMHPTYQGDVHDIMQAVRQEATSIL